MCNCPSTQTKGPSFPCNLCTFLDSAKPNKVFTVPEKLFNISATVNELSLKSDQLKNATIIQAGDCFCATNFRCWQWLINGVINILLGTVLLTLFLLYGSAFSSGLFQYTEWVVIKMIWLLEWLMDVPAGLKLNGKLTVFLGRFFMYHIWLWSEYLKIAGSYFDRVLMVIGILGLPGGLSLQLALLQDTMNVYFLHIYCFHIYTARLYRLVHSSVLSLWRLFRGLKWNTLRERVDHASYDSTQLFIGTLLFSILLFILPTVLLYYIVFGFVSIHHCADLFK
ncbi:PIGQ [Bugula neritina]|uniref:PIGQ n=1 Tax=Bugula neritina TaxID=10212 RepID=A0A7J7J006_BUGNE|nr:PIGQ [Bugula neritina]